MLISIETQITCDFPGGSGGPDPHPPLDPHMFSCVFITLRGGVLDKV